MFRRIANLFRGFLGLFISGLDRQNPEALLEVEKENIRKQIANYNQGLAAHAGLCERLMSQVETSRSRGAGAARKNLGEPARRQSRSSQPAGAASAARATRAGREPHATRIGGSDLQRIAARARRFRSKPRRLTRIAQEQPQRSEDQASDRRIKRNGLGDDLADRRLRRHAQPPARPWSKKSATKPPAAPASRATLCTRPTSTCRRANRKRSPIRRSRTSRRRKGWRSNPRPELPRPRPSHDGRAEKLRPADRIARAHAALSQRSLLGAPATRGPRPHSMERAPGRRRGPPRLRPPAIWLGALGAETLYLYVLATNPRFQNWVNAKDLARLHDGDDVSNRRLVANLPDVMRRPSPRSKTSATRSRRCTESRRTRTTSTTRTAKRCRS